MLISQLPTDRKVVVCTSRGSCCFLPMFILFPQMTLWSWLITRSVLISSLHFVYSSSGAAHSLLNKSSCSVCTQQTQWELCAGKHHQVQTNVFFLCLVCECLSVGQRLIATCEAEELHPPSVRSKTLLLMKVQRESKRGSCAYQRQQRGRERACSFGQKGR